LGRFLSESRSDVAKVSWSDAISKSLRFSVRPKRFLPFFITDLIMVLLLLVLIGGTTDLMTLVSYAEGMLPVEAAAVLAWGSVLMVVWVLVSVWVTGAVIHQGANPDDFRGSWKASLARMPSLVGALIVVSLVSVMASLVPFIGIVLSFFVSLLFFFVNQVVVLEKGRFDRALSASVRTFRRKAGNVIVAWLLDTLVGIAIVAVFMIPIFILLSYTIYSVGPLATDEEMMAMVAGPQFQLAIVIMMFGLSISKTFNLAFITEVYLQLKKKRWLFF
jgi:hypothetical protein